MKKIYRSTKWANLIDYGQVDLTVINFVGFSTKFWIFIYTVFKCMPNAIWNTPYLIKFLHWKYPLRHISKFLNSYWFVATLIDIITHRFLITLFQNWENMKYALVFFFNEKISFFYQIRSVSDSIRHTLEDSMNKNSEFSRKSDQIDYGQVHLSVINKICPFCAAVYFFHVYDLLL